MRESKGRGSPEGERRTRDPRLHIEPVVLTRKLADAIDGIDLAGHDVGDRLPLNPYEATLLIKEGWARPVPDAQRRHTHEQGTSEPYPDPPRQGPIA